MEHVPSPARRHIVSVPVGPEAVRQARQAVAEPADEYDGKAVLVRFGMPS
jgi:hypothetical protein